MRIYAGLGIVAFVLGILCVAWLLSEGTYEISSTPAGAEVLFDGRPVGVTPLTLSTHVSATTGTVEIRLEGYETHTEVISIEPRGKGQLAVNLAGLPVALEITSEPAGATAYLDGVEVGKTPVTVDNVAPAVHKVRLQLANYESWEQEVEVIPGRRNVVGPKLTGLPGGLEIVSAPAGAKVYLDDKEVGITPVTISSAAAGEHTVRLVKDGYSERIVQATVPAKGNARTEVALAHALPADATFQRPIAAMIDNSPFARPQSGISSADVVFEALVEGGVTRFMALFATRQVDVIGPIRSSRHYFVHWADEFNALYAHCGASPQGFDAIAATGIADLDEHAGSPGFWRSNNREAPHNLYTSTADLRAEADRRGLRKDLGSFGGLVFEEEPSLLEGEQAHALALYYPFGHTVEWTYDPERNDYLRATSGEPDIDPNTGAQVRGTSIVVLFMNNWWIPGDELGRQDFEQVGSGEALFFMDGRVAKGSWSKESYQSPTVHYDESGNPMPLNSGGTTWIQVAPPDIELAIE